MKKQNHARVFAATTVGVDSLLIEVEADLSFGMMNFFIVGLPDKSIKESKDRIRAAFKNSGLCLPDRLITINLAPADIKKQEALFDIPIAVALLQAANILQMSTEFMEETVFLGELALNGDIRSIRGALPIAHGAKLAGKKRVILPNENCFEASAIQDLEIIGVKNLTELVKFLRNEEKIQATPHLTNFNNSSQIHSLDFSQVKGQESAKKALVVAATGEHNILFIGPPGSGKTMLAERLPSILPECSFSDMIDVSKIYSIAGLLPNKKLLNHRPFRSPHHTVSHVGLAGGGSNPVPGEISLAHKGVLFLDELTEFSRHSIEVLRQPLENGKITISRAGCSITYPANFLLVAAFNPCPCGYFKTNGKTCVCSEQQIKKYISKLSGPILDRIDIHINVSSLNYQELTIDNKESQILSSEQMKNLVKVGIKMRTKRGQTEPNAQISSDKIKTLCAMTNSAEELLKKYFDKFNFSARSYHKILKLARTIADISEKETIDDASIKQAIFFRSLDRK